MRTELQDLAQELREGARRLIQEADDLSRYESILFLKSYGRLAWEFGLWVESQEKAGILPAEDIVRLATFPLEVVRTHSHR